MTNPEFSRPERIDTIGAGERSVTIAADATERAALAVRFGLVSIDRLEATLAVRQEAAGIAVRGRVGADVVQACTVTDDPIPVTVDEPVALRFVAESGAGAAQALREAGVLSEEDEAARPKGALAGLGDLLGKKPS